MLLSPTFPRDFQPLVLWTSCKYFLFCAYGAITLCDIAFQLFRLQTVKYCARAVHHISHIFPYGIQFDLFRVQSPLLAESPLFSFPAGTMMFQFPALPILKDHISLLGLYRKSHSEILGSKPACGYPRRIAACRVLHRRQSQGIHNVAYAKDEVTTINQL